MKDKVLGLICEALELTPGSVVVDTVVADVPEWDSIGWLTIMSLLDEQLGVQISAQEIRSIHTAGDLVRIVERK